MWNHDDSDVSNDIIFDTNTYISFISQNIRDLTYKLGECEVDCDRDKDCQEGLVCAQTQKNLLKYYKDCGEGIDIRKAYCGKVGGPKAEVCFDPEYFSYNCHY